jgi:REP element-mobilizing transposase RayT
MSSGIYNKFTGYHNRRSIRLPGYDYSRPGYYFVTICIRNRAERLFGDIDFVGAGSKPAPESVPEPAPESVPQPTHARMILNEFGNIVQCAWDDLINHVPGIALDTFVIMPNHVHGIIRIIGTGLEPAPTTAPTTATAKQITLPEIIRQFKTFSARRINAIRHVQNNPVWQRNYYDHIIRGEKSLYVIRKYIRENPLHWREDSENHIDREIEEFKLSSALQKEMKKHPRSKHFN